MEVTSLPRIAIIEDNDDFREEVLFYLQHRGFTAWGARSAEAFWKALHFHPTDIVLIDLGLPEEDGFSVVDHLQKLSGYGLVIVTARGSKSDRLRCLDLGADIFLVKPINFAQLNDTLITLAQRLKIKAVETHNPNDQGAWFLAPGASELITPDKSAIRLTPKEFDLLSILIEHANQIFDRRSLHDLLFEHSDEPDTHRIDVVLSRLRQKARQKGVQLPLRSVFGKGITFIME